MTKQESDADHSADTTETGPTTGTTGRGEGATSGVSVEEAAERINPGSSGEGSGFSDPSPPDDR